jgi:hypothetical protein
MGETGVNAALSYSTTENGTYTILASVKDFDIAGFEMKTLEVKALRITNGWVQKLKGFKDGGKVSFQLEHDDDELAELQTRFKAGTKYWYKFELDNTGGTNGSMVKFEGIMSKYTPLKTDEDGKVTNSAELDISGEPTFSPATGP